MSPRIHDKATYRIDRLIDKVNSHGPSKPFQPEEFQAEIVPVSEYLEIIIP